MSEPPTFTLERWLTILIVSVLSAVALLIAIPYGQNGWIWDHNIRHMPPGTVVACRGDCSR